MTPQRGTPQEANPSLERPLVCYGARAVARLAMLPSGRSIPDWQVYTAAVGAALSMAASAEAAMMYSGPQNIELVSTPAGGELDLDLDGNGRADIALRLGVTQSCSHVASDLRLMAFPRNAILTTGGRVKPLNSGATISADAGQFGVNLLLTAESRGQFCTTTTTTTTTTTCRCSCCSFTRDGRLHRQSPSQDAFVGVRFRIGSNEHFGWIRLHVTGVRAAKAIDWAYEDQPHTPIRTPDMRALACLSAPATFATMQVGTQDDDVLEGTSGNDLIVGLEGDDVIAGLGGDDILCGGPGNDTLRGGSGQDVLMGGPGKDQLYGGAGKDQFDGGRGIDGCFGGPGVDTATACEQEQLIP